MLNNSVGVTLAPMLSLAMDQRGVTVPIGVPTVRFGTTLAA
jgi:hypothetical protein